MALPSGRLFYTEAQRRWMACWLAPWRSPKPVSWTNPPILIGITEGRLVALLGGALAAGGPFRYCRQSDCADWSEAAIGGKQ
jgi:hypothetical protein